jgi:F0F1-type ATP synthase membrane subunit b/b'
MTDISSQFEKAKAELQAERDSMVQKVKEEIAQSKRKALSKV